MMVAAPRALPSRSVPSVKRRNSAAASSSCGVRRREEPGQHRVVGLGGRPREVHHRLERVDVVARRRRLVAEQLDQLRGQRAEQVGLEAGEVRDDPAAAAVPGEAGHRWRLLHRVAHRPYSCIACTSRSISSRLPVLTTDLPSSCTSSISFSAFFFVVAEVLLEDVGDVGHQVDRVVPDDGDPRRGQHGDRRRERSSARPRRGWRRTRPHRGTRSALAPAALGWTRDRAHSTALLTDHYELTMLQAALAGRHGRAPLRLRAVRPAAARGPPLRRRGRGRPGAATRSRRSASTTTALAAARAASSTSRPLDWLAGYRFSGDVWGYAEGEVYFPDSPLLIVEAQLRRGGAAGDGAALDLQPRLRDRLRRLPDDRVARRAGRASRWARAAPTSRRRSRPRGRRTSPASTRTSNLAAAPALRRARRPAPARTAFTLLHDTERDAFRAQVAVARRRARRCWSTPTTSPRRSGSASRWPGPALGAVRLDSGDLGALAQQVRAAARRARRHDTQIVVTSDLDEYAIAALAAAPVDGYGVGTQLVTGSGHPTCGFVYKLVARARTTDGAAGVGGQEERATRSRSAGASTPLRRPRRDGRRRGRGDRHRRSPPRDDGDDRQLLVPLVAGGEVVGREPLEDGPRAARAPRGPSCRSRRRRCRAASR